MTYFKLLFALFAGWAVLNGFVAVHGYDHYDLIDEVIEASQDCTTDLVYRTGRRTSRNIYGIQQLCTTTDGYRTITSKKTLFIDFDNLTWSRFNGWYRN